VVYCLCLCFLITHFRKGSAIMTSAPSKGKLFCIAGGAVLLFTLLARICSVLYSTAATDILYAETILPDVLTVLRQILSSAAFGTALAFAARSFAGFGGIFAAVGISCGIFLLDAASSFLIDAAGGAVSSDLLPLAAVLNLGDWLFSALLLLIAALVIRHAAKKQRSAGWGLAGGALIWLIGRMLLQLFYIVSFLIEVEFQPYGSEIVQMLGEILQVLFTGGVVWLCAVGLYALFCRICGKNPVFL